MKTRLTRLYALFFLFSAVCRLYSQGHIVPNGVVTNLYPGEIDVWNPGTQTTGFSLTPAGKQQPTVYNNVFRFTEPATIGVRVFLVSANDAISLQPIQAGAWTELQESANYVFQHGAPFYVGLYTGANFAPPYPPYPPYFYNDPVFGWALLANNQGTIQVLDSAVEYGGAGIYAGTRNIIPVPEPGPVPLFAFLGALFTIWSRQPNTYQARAVNS